MKRKFEKPSLSLHHVPVRKGAWQQIGTETLSGNKYIMTVTDYFSKWPEAKAIPTKEAYQVAEFCTHYSCNMAFALVSSLTKGANSAIGSLIVCFN